MNIIVVGKNTKQKLRIFHQNWRDPAGSDLQSESFTIRIRNPIFTMLTIKQIY